LKKKEARGKKAIKGIQKVGQQRRRADRKKKILGVENQNAD